MKRFLALCAVVFASGLSLHPVAAQTIVATGDTHIDFTPAVTQLLTQYVLPGLGVVVMALLSWVAWLVKQKLGVDIQQSYLKQVSDFAEKKAGEILAKVTNVAAFDIDVRNPLIAAAAREAMLHIPDALAYFHVSPASVEAFIAQFIVSHLGSLTKAEPDQPGPAIAPPVPAVA